MRWTIVAVGVLVAVVVLAWLMPPMQGMRERSARVKSADNIRTMITMMISARTEAEGVAPLGMRGRNALLGLVVSTSIDARNRQNLEALWPPNLEDRLENLDWSAYKALTPELLSTQRFPHLTGYSGPGKPQADWKGPIPLIGDLTFEDGAVVGFTDGRARWLDREELGLGPDDPIVAGPMSRSPLLRMLSNE